MTEGMDELDRKLEKLAQQSGSIGKKAAQNAIKKVQARAKFLCPVNEGELRNSIQTSVKQTGKQIEATCYTNKSYAGYVEFGTGPKGAKEHSGISPEVNPVYKVHGWAFPASAITSGEYHFPERIYGGEKYYLTSGQAAQPFMYPALKDGEKEVIKAMIRSGKINIGKEIHD